MPYRAFRDRGTGSVARFQLSIHKSDRFNANLALVIGSGHGALLGGASHAVAIAIAPEFSLLVSHGQASEVANALAFGFIAAS